MKIIPLDKNNQSLAVAYLDKHEESCQFLINNLRSYGASIGEHANSGNYKMILDKSQVVGVFCLSRQGVLMAQSSFDFGSEIIEDCLKEAQPIKSFVGDWKSIEKIYEQYLIYNPNYSPALKSKEILYRYELKNQDSRLLHSEKVSLLTVADFEAWLVLREAYCAELNLPFKLTIKEQKKSYNETIKDKLWWGLFIDKKLISIATLTSRSDRIGQVGGVFTKNEHRKKGYGKTLMFHMLKDCLSRYSHQKSILFTGETDIAAQKLYESMGYQRIGHFALILA